MAQVFDVPLTTTDQSLDRVLGTGMPVALVFLGNGGSSLDETLARLAAKYAGELLFVKIQAAENPESARRFKIGALPAVVTVRRGETLSQGDAVTPAELEQHVSYLLGQGPRPAPQPQTAPAGAARPSAHANGGSGAAVGGQPVVVTDATFEQQVLRSTEPVLIDFWAPWCGPCRLVGPIVERLAGEMAGRLRVAKVNVDENPRLSDQFSVQGIPTMMIFKGGQMVDRWTGALPEPAIRQHLRKATGL